MLSNPESPAFRPSARLRGVPGHAGRLVMPGLVVRLVIRGLVGLPLALASVPLALVGGADAAVRAHTAVIRRFGPGVAPAAAQAAGPARILGHSALVLVPALVVFAAVAVSLFVCWSGYLYFLRPDAIGALDHPFTADPLLDNAWGGPTLAGAWAVHSLVATAIQAASLVLTHALTTLQDRTTRRLLGGRHSQADR